MFEQYTWLHRDFVALARRAQARKLHHGLLLAGNEGLGKAEFALIFAQYLLCSNKSGDRACGQCQSCMLNAADTHPDLHIVESEKQIGVDLIRQSIEKLTSKSHISENRVLIIYQADSMTEAASNALLKTLEEPMSGAYLCLVSAKPNSLLPTILSRCEKIKLSKPEKPELLTFIQNNGYTVEETLIHMYANSPLKLIDELKGSEGRSFASFETLLSALKTKDANILSLAKDWEGDTSKFLSWLQFWIKNEMATSYQDSLMALYQSSLEVQKICAQAGINKLLHLSDLLACLQNHFAEGAKVVR